MGSQDHGGSGATSIAGRQDGKAHSTRAGNPAAFLCGHAAVARHAGREHPWAAYHLTVKLESLQDAWLSRQARTLKRSKGQIVRELIQPQQARPNGSLGQALADLCGCLSGSKDLSTRPLKRHGRP